MSFQFAHRFAAKAKPVRRKLASTVTPTGRERSFGENELIVSKTDLKGVITYANDVFLRIAGYREEDVIGAPHSVIRHPDMPRCVFKLLWDTLAAEKEIFAYVKNMSANGDHYWVLAHVTPSFAESGQVTGYHSNRRVPDRRIVEQVIAPLYAALLAEERRHGDRRSGLAASSSMLQQALQEKGVDYDRFILSL